MCACVCVFSWSGELCVDRLLVPVLGAVAWLGLGDGGVHGPLAGTHVVKGGVNRALACWVIGGGAALLVGVVILWPVDAWWEGRGWSGSGVVLQVKGAIMGRTQLLGFDVRCPLLALILTRACSTHLRAGARALGHPTGGRWAHPAVPGVPVRWQVLVKLGHVKALHVWDDVAAQFTQVHVTEVDVKLTLPARANSYSDAIREWAALAFWLTFACLSVNFGGSGRSRGTLRLACVLSTVQLNTSEATLAIN